METLDWDKVQLQVCFQVAKMSRPLISVFKVTEMGELHALRQKDEALVIMSQGATVALFARKGGFYVATMQVKNPCFQAFQRQAKK